MPTCLDNKALKLPHFEAQKAPPRGSASYTMLTNKVVHRKRGQLAANMHWRDPATSTSPR